MCPRFAVAPRPALAYLFALRPQTTFDTADIYGPSEAVIGRFRETHPDAKFEVFTKCVPNVFREKPTRATIEAGIARSCAALQQQKLDLVQLHWCVAVATDSPAVCRCA